MGRLYLYRSSMWYVRRLRARVVNSRECRLYTPAAVFFNAVRDGHFDAETYIDVLPQHGLIYLWVPKAASTTIRSVLSSLEFGTPPGPPLELLNSRRCTGIRSPRLAGFSVFHRLAFIGSPKAQKLYGLLLFEIPMRVCCPHGAIGFKADHSPKDIRASTLIEPTARRFLVRCPMDRTKPCRFRSLSSLRLQQSINGSTSIGNCRTTLPRCLGYR